jgi:hypothetical protein
MPVTAKLSRNFYERFGDDVANELVDWFNAVDLTYRTQLREFNDLNWQRFEAGMDARFAEYDLKMDRRFAAFEAKMEQRFAGLEATIDHRFAGVDRRFGEADKRLTALQVKLEQRFTEQSRWMIGLWLGTVLPLGGLMVGLFTYTR